MVSSGRSPTPRSPTWSIVSPVPGSKGGGGLPAAFLCRPSHERRVAEAVAERLRASTSSASHDVLSVFREYERTSTTVIDAYLSPLLRRYLERLGGGRPWPGCPRPRSCSSSGGPDARASGRHAHAAWTVLSGPAGGRRRRGALLGALAGSEHVLSFDMGGTSSDVAVIDGGRVARPRTRRSRGRALSAADGRRAHGRRRRRQHRLGGPGRRAAGRAAVGGGRSRPGLLRARRQRADGDRRRTSCSATSAPSPRWPAACSSTADAAERAVASLGRRLGLSTARRRRAGIAARRRPRDGPRAAGRDGGARGRPAALRAGRVRRRGPDARRSRIAEELEHRAGPVPARRRASCPRSAWSSPSAAPRPRAQRDAREAELDAGRARRGRPRAGRRGPGGAAGRAGSKSLYDLRYRGPGLRADRRGRRATRRLALLRERFERAHAERYGYADPEAELELVNVRVAARRRPRRRRPRGARRSRAGRAIERAARFAAGGPRRTVLAASSRPARRSRARRSASCRRRRSWCRRAGTARATQHGTLVLERRDDRPASTRSRCRCWRARCAPSARRWARCSCASAHSANIKERRDASTALFDAGGEMVMQAEHIPVHLGAMPDAVAAVRRARASAGRRLDPQRPLPRAARTCPTSRWSRRSSSAARRIGVRREPRAPRRRRRGARRAACRPTRRRSTRRAW